MHTFPSVSAFSPTHALPSLPPGISWEDACERRDEAAQRMAAAEGETHKHASGFYMGAWGCWGPALFALAWLSEHAGIVTTCPNPFPRGTALRASLSSLPTPAGDLLVTAGGSKRPKLVVLASEIGKTVTGSTKLAIAVR